MDDIESQVNHEFEAKFGVDWEISLPKTDKRLNPKLLFHIVVIEKMNKRIKILNQMRKYN